jgi:uncharacterized membrane protein YhaH (DUF805 family)
MQAAPAQPYVQAGSYALAGRGLSFGDAIKTCFNKYVDFEGRACRAEFWWWMLFGALAGFAANVCGLTVDAAGNTQVFTSLFGGLASLALFLPNLAVTFRRLHDIGRSGWWAFGILVWLIIVVITLVIIGAAASLGTAAGAGQGNTSGASDIVVGILAILFGLSLLAYSIMLLVWYCTRGNPGPNRYGPDPLG